MQNSDFFKGLPSQEIDDFLTASNFKSYMKHQNILFHGDRADRVFFVASGWIKLYRQTKSGDEAVIHICDKGSMFGEAAVMTKENYGFSAEAAEDSELVEIPADFIHFKANGNFEIMSRLFKSVSRDVKETQSDNEHLSLMSAPQRVGCLLLQLSSGMIGKGGTFSFPYDKLLAASKLGMKPETFSRALVQLKLADVHVNGPEITIGSFEKLMNYCCHQCSSMPGECRKVK